MRKEILITGASGFIGSAFAAANIKDCNICHIVVRKGGIDKYEKAIRRAFIGLFEEDLYDKYKSNIRYIMLPKNENELLLFIDETNKVQEVWHFAARMTYDIKSVSKSLEDNTKQTVLLYDLCNQMKSMKHFYFISTAYVNGLQESITETIDFPNVNFLNSYQISKFFTETSLSKRYYENKTDDGKRVALDKHSLNIVRPTIIIGSSKTGWYGDKNYGFYSFLKVFNKLASNGLRYFPKVFFCKNKLNTLPVDLFIENLRLLQEFNNTESLNVINIFGESMNLDLYYSFLEDVYKIKPIDMQNKFIKKIISKQMGDNSLFTNLNKYEEENFKKITEQNVIKNREEDIKKAIETYKSQNQNDAGEKILSMIMKTLNLIFYISCKIKK